MLEAKRRAAEQNQMQQQQSQQNSNTNTNLQNGLNKAQLSPHPTIDISQRAMQPPPPPMPSTSNHGNSHHDVQDKLPYKFTRTPSEMQGERISTSLVKSARGLGLTIVGGGDEITEEFLQIKNIVPNGPAWLDGQLKMGDVLVYVNDICVLGFTHHQMVSSNYLVFIITLFIFTYNCR